MFEVLPPVIRNGQHLRRERQDEGLLGALLHIQHIANGLLQVPVLLHGVDHRHDGLVHGVESLVTLLRTARPAGGWGDARWPGFFIVIL